MEKHFRAVAVLPTLAWLCVASSVPLTGQTCCPGATQRELREGNEVVQEFPPDGPSQTAWRVRFDHATNKGLFITGAWFRRSPVEAWIQVLGDARLSDIFVPYNSGDPNRRFLDLTSFQFDLIPVSKIDLGCCGVDLDGFVVKEIRDRGMLWKDDRLGRRGYELVLWATLDAENYNYIMEYGFQDDGTISFRLGATARNLPGYEFETHMHNGLWRIDIDLNGPDHDSVLLVRRLEPATGVTASEPITPFNAGREGSADWNDLEFTQIRVIDTKAKNIHGRSIGYDLILRRQGTARHAETYTHHDFWVSRYRFEEMFYTQVPRYVSDRDQITNTDVVLWYISPIHHQPRNEDGMRQGPVWKGVALVMWGGFDLRPRNLFGQTPLFP